MPQDNTTIRNAERDFEREHPKDPANAPGWDQHVDEFFNSEAFPGDGVRKATDAMRDARLSDPLDNRLSGQGEGDEVSPRSGNSAKNISRPRHSDPGEH